MRKDAWNLRMFPFSYREGGEPVLSHISLTAEPGETIGILGATGSGKNVAGTADSPPL